MIYDGLHFRKATNVVFRSVQHFDRSIDDNTIDSNFCMFVKIEDINAKPTDKADIYLAALNSAKAIACDGHSLTNMMYGKAKFIKRKSTISPVMVLKAGSKVPSFSQYIKEIPVYLAKSGSVYKTTIRNAISKTDYLKNMTKQHT